MQEEAFLLTLIRDLCASQRLAVLATHGDGQPYLSLMACAATADLKYIIFATLRSTRKYANLRAHDRVAMMVDNRVNREADFKQAVAVTILGQAAEVDSLEKDQLLKIYLHKHPYLEDFVNSLECAVLKLKVDRCLVVREFQKVREVKIPT